MTRLRQLWLLTALGTLVVLAGGYMFLVTPQSKKAAALREETDTQLQVNRQLQSQIDMLNKQKKDLPAQQAKLAKFARLIPPNPAMPALVRSLTDAADNSGVELVSIAPVLPEWAKGHDTKTRTEIPGRVPGPNGTALAAIAVKLKVIGSYSQITQFFTEVEELNRAMLVGGFKVEQAGNDQREVAGGEVAEDPDLLKAEIEAQVMMTKKSAVPAPVAPPTTETTS